MKTVIVQSGPENSGKTSTIRMMYEMLRNKYPDAAAKHVLDRGKDVRAVLTLGGICIGIESLGDPWKKTARLEPSLALFVQLKCEVIICAARTSGGTLEASRKLEDDGYTVTVRSRTREDGSNKQEQRNRAEASWIIEQIEESFVEATV